MSASILGSAELLSLAPGPPQTRTHTFLNYRPFELGEHGHHLEHGLAGRGSW